MTAVPPVADFDRCDPGLLTRLSELGASTVSDAMDRFGALDSQITTQWSGARLVGSAFTVSTREGDNLAIHEALDLAPGDVLVVNGGGDRNRALIGEMIGINVMIGVIGVGAGIWIASTDRKDSKSAGHEAQAGH